MLSLPLACFLVAAPIPQMEDDLPTLSIRLHAAKAPTPALRYPLMHPLRDQKPGDAATAYARVALALEKKNPWKENDDLQSAWLEMKPEEIPLKEAKEFLKPYEAMLAEFEEATRIKRCEWGMDERIQAHGTAALIPQEMLQLRGVVNLLSIRLRVEVREGRQADAVATIRTQLAYSRHLTNQPSLLVTLISMAIAGNAVDELLEYVQSPAACNLLWSLADLPEPFVELRSALDGERMFLDSHFPGVRELLRNPNAASLSQDQLRKAIDHCMMVRDMLRQNQYLAALQVAARVRALQDAAKKTLKERGWTQKQIDARSGLELALCYEYLASERNLDEAQKCLAFPNWKGRERAKAAVKLEDEDKLPRLLAMPASPRIGIGQPAKHEPERPFHSVSMMERMLLAQARLDRKLAIARVFEALRLYASEHGGALPAKLDDLKDLPIPVDPITGKAFQYELKEKNQAILFAPPPNDEKPEQFNCIRYKITMEK